MLAIGVTFLLTQYDKTPKEVDSARTEDDDEEGDLVFELARVMALPPKAEINTTCFPPILPSIQHAKEKQD